MRSDTRRTEFGEGVFLDDWGDTEYLDGVQMQYMVAEEGFRGCVAYFGRREDAELFARAKAEQLRGEQP